MKIIHQNGYSPEELALYRLTIYKNLIDCSKALIAAMDQFEVRPSTPQVQENCDYLTNYQVSADPNTPLDREVGAAVVAMCRDASFMQVMEHQSEFYLMDSAP